MCIFKKLVNKKNYIFTDASLKKKAGIGIYYQNPTIQIPIQKYYYIDGKKDINRAELAAIYVGLLLYPLVAHAPLVTHIDLFSDSITAINLIEDRTYNAKFDMLVQCIRYLSSKKYSNTKIIYTKVKAHSGIKENDIAHYLARCGARSTEETPDANTQLFHIPDASSKSISNIIIEELVLENIYKNSLLYSDISLQ
jgi:ribonuclease HI